MKHKKQAEKQRNKRGTLVLICTTVVALGFGLGMGIGWLVFGTDKEELQSKQTQPVAQQTQKQDTVDTAQPEDITDTIRKVYAAKYTLLEIDQNNQPQSGEMSIRVSETSPVYKAEDSPVYTDYEGGSTIDMMLPAQGVESVLPSLDETKLRTELAGILQEAGLTKTDTTGSEGGDSAVDTYIGKGLVCTTEAPMAPVSPSSVSCGLISEYKTAIEKMKPFINALPSVQPTTVLTGLKITDSLVSGYQRAGVNVSGIGGIGGSVALFYRKSTGTWVYFTNVQQAISCSEYDTDDLKNAFKGETCYSEDNREVKL
ncbi:MAG TPA: hypothetical protein PKD19_04555 [Candidatus Saccharibacteria bacterium]|nr:hypothetical protein [Candidatus Saccharibacteria bacterium]HMR38612.1 hypothetical protein [Candidatus Saccharibacteria bacterium]